MRMRAALAGVLTLALFTTGCQSVQTGETADPAGKVNCVAGPGPITIATGNSGGVYSVLGTGLARLISQNTAISATAVETGASVQNIQQLVAGEHDVAFAQADSATDAVKGIGTFAGRPQKVQALARLYPNSTQVLVRNAAGITSVAGMRGKRIATGSPRSGTEVIANRLLQAAGLNPETDIQAQRLDLAAAEAGLKSGAIDGLIWSGGLPSAQITDITSTLRGQVSFLDLGGLLDEMKKISQVYVPGTIPAAVYGQPADVATIDVPTLLLVRGDFPEPNACAITKLIFEKKAELEQVHPAAKLIDRKIAGQTDPVPLNTGALQALGG